MNWWHPQGMEIKAHFSHRQNTGTVMKQQPDFSYHSTITMRIVLEVTTHTTRVSCSGMYPNWIYLSWRAEQINAKGLESENIYHHALINGMINIYDQAVEK